MGRFSGIYAREKSIARIYDNECPHCHQEIYVNGSNGVTFHHPDECGRRYDKPSVMIEVNRDEEMERRINFKISRLKTRYEIMKEALHLFSCYVKAFYNFKK